MVFVEAFAHYCLFMVYDNENKLNSRNVTYSLRLPWKLRTLAEKCALYEGGGTLEAAVDIHDRSKLFIRSKYRGTSRVQEHR